jgi:hypothetical protein
LPGQNAAHDDEPELAAAQFLAGRGMDSEPPGFGDGEFFEFRLSRCLLTSTDSNGDGNPPPTVRAASA